MDAALRGRRRGVVANEDGTIEVITPGRARVRARSAREVGPQARTGRGDDEPLAETVLTGGDAERMQRLIDALDDLDDVQQVYTTAALEE